MKRRTTSSVIGSLCAIAVIAQLASCVSNDLPEANDCSLSDLGITLATKSDVSGCAVQDGSATLEATGGKAPYQFSINGGSFGTSNIFSGLEAGSYTFVVKDQNGCERILTPNVVIGSPEGPVIGESVVVGDSGCDSDDGSITVSASGGTGTLSYSLNGTDFQAANSFDNLHTGQYIITVKDEGGCSSTVNETVPSETGITYAEDILPIFQAKCQFSGCHPTNGNWFDYAVASANAQLIKTRTGNGSMPRAPQPGGALSEEQIAIIACWADNGTPE